MKIFGNTPGGNADEGLKALEKELGEPLLYKTTGRLLAASGLSSVPFDSWGLVGLTPTRFVFRHFSQPHPLFGGKDQEQTWSVARDRFESCVARRIGFWSKLFSGTSDHVALMGPGVHLNLEISDDPESLPRAWLAPAP